MKSSKYDMVRSGMEIQQNNNKTFTHQYWLSDKNITGSDIYEVLGQIRRYQNQLQGIPSTDQVQIVNEEEEEEKSDNNQNVQLNEADLIRQKSQNPQSLGLEVMSQIEAEEQKEGNDKQQEIQTMSIDHQNIKYQLHLRKNEIGVIGCERLSRVQWKQLILLSLVSCRITDEACKYLARGQWINLQFLYLRTNLIGQKGAKYLSKSNWPTLQQYYASENRISDKGCISITKSNWPELKMLNLFSNKIRGRGCEYLSKGQWQSLNTLNLNSNKIKKQAILFLKGKSRNIYFD